MSSDTSQPTSQSVSSLSLTSTNSSGSLSSNPTPTKKIEEERSDNYQKPRDGITTTRLLVEGKELFVSRELLAAASPVWEAMFSKHNIKKSQSEVIPLPGKKLQTVIWFLDYLYPETPFEMTDDKAAKLLPLADEYKMVLLKEKCVAELMNQANPRLEVACLAARYNLEELLSKAIEFCAKGVDSRDLEEQRKQLSSDKHLDADVLINILRRKLEIKRPRSNMSTTEPAY